MYEPKTVAYEGRPGRPLDCVSAESDGDGDGNPESKSEPILSTTEVTSFRLKGKRCSDDKRISSQSIVMSCICLGFCFERLNF